MEDLVNTTYARNNFKSLLDQVINEGKTFILLRKSQPQAALVPYEEILAKKRKWQKRFAALTAESQPSFKRWLKKKGAVKEDLSETKVYQLLDEKD